MADGYGRWPAISIAISHQPSAMTETSSRPRSAAPTARRPRARCRTAAAADPPIPSISAMRRDQGAWRRSGTPTTTCAAPQRIAMNASVVKAAAVIPAATWPPPLRLADAISATAPTPSASVERPTSTVSRPQTTKSTPRKSTWRLHSGDWMADGTRAEGLTGLGRRRTDRDAQLDAHRHARRATCRRKRTQAPSATRGGTDTRSAC